MDSDYLEICELPEDYFSDFIDDLSFNGGGFVQTNHDDIMDMLVEIHDVGEISFNASI